MKNIEYEEFIYDFRLPLIDVIIYIGGNRLNLKGMIDTGSTNSIIISKIVDSNPDIFFEMVSTVSESLIAGNGNLEIFEINDTHQVAISETNHQVNVKFFTANIDSLDFDVILGQSFLQQFKEFCLNANEKTFKLYYKL